GLVDAAVVADGDVDDGHRVTLAEVADTQYLAVSDIPDSAVEVAECGDAQSHRLHRAGGLTDVHDVTDAVLVLQHHEDARQEVPDEVLRAETDGHADDTGGGEDGSEVDAQFAEDQHERQAEHHETGQRLQQRTYGLGSLPTPLQHHGTEDFGGPFLQGP